MYEINQLEELLQSSYCDPAITLLDYKAERLTAPGENYGSLMLALKIQLNDSKQKEKILNIVAKMIPENDWLREVFNVQFTFVKEMNFYDTVIPTLQQFQREQGISEIMDLFPKYFGGRINLNRESKIVDDDAILLLENLKLNGFTTHDRTKGFDLEMTKLILENIAVFHAVPLALKLLKPDVFEEKILPHIKFVKLFQPDNKEELEEKMVQQILDVTNKISDCAHLVDRVEKAIRNSFDAWGTLHETLFATITHNDCWINNIMVKFEKGKPVSNKIIDFQIVDYGSPAKDIVLFLFSSIQMAVIEKHYSELLCLYFNTFIKTLKQLKCDTNQFKFEDFEDELGVVANRTEFCRCIWMTKPILATPEGMKELKDLSPDDMLEDKVSERQREKIMFIIREFAKRNWI